MKMFDSVEAMWAAEAKKRHEKSPPTVGDAMYLGRRPVTVAHVSRDLVIYAAGHVAIGTAPASDLTREPD
jgi:hypothetical protein